MKAKKFFAGMSAAALAMSLAVPALAAMNNPYKVTYSGEQAPASSVNIDVPNSGKLYLNPFGLNATLVTTAPAAGGNYMKSGSTFDKVYSDVMVLTNRGTTPLSVSITAGVKPDSSSAVEIAANPTRLLQSEATVYFEIDDVAAPTVESTTNGGTTVETRGFDTPEWTGNYKVTLPEDDGSALATQDTGYTLKAAKEEFEVDPFTGEKTSLGVQPSYAAFHLGGDVGEAPDAGWGTNDKVTATVAFSFSPVTDNAAG